ncbi:hypothetical protein [Natrinema caseinilyticum]|uniref:hypothetical protein n=1 Tax=Natrinema caseinilyticum TaxID=2961570 RepID=UPI0020C290A0|nr:hypothetical protein [Natrinema caseinilyticum]
MVSAVLVVGVIGPSASAGLAYVFCLVVPTSLASRRSGRFLAGPTGFEPFAPFSTVPTDFGPV